MTDEKEKQEPTSDNSGAGNNPSTTSMLERGESIVERMEKANAEAQKLIAQQTELATRNVLGGRAVAGQKSQTEDEKEDEEALLTAKNFFP